MTQNTGKDRITFDDIIKSSVYAFIILTCIVFVGALFFNWVDNRGCEKLRAITSNQKYSDEILHAAQIYLRKPNYYNQANQERGLIFIRDLKDNLNVDWDKLGIPLRYASIDIRGKDVNYKNIMPNQVEEIRVGIGYSDHLVYKINSLDNQYELKVECVKD